MNPTLFCLLADPLFYIVLSVSSISYIIIAAMFMLYDQEKSSFRYNALTEITRKVVDFDDIKFLNCLIK